MFCPLESSENTIAIIKAKIFFICFPPITVINPKCESHLTISGRKNKTTSSDFQIQKPKPMFSSQGNVDLFVFVVFLTIQLVS